MITLKCDTCKELFDTNEDRIRKIRCSECRAKQYKETKRLYSERMREDKKKKKSILLLKKSLNKGDYYEIINVIRDHFLDDSIIQKLEQYSEKIKNQDTFGATSLDFSYSIPKSGKKRMWSKDEIIELIKFENGKTN